MNFRTKMGQMPRGEWSNLLTFHSHPTTAATVNNLLAKYSIRPAFQITCRLTKFVQMRSTCCASRRGPRAGSCVVACLHHRLPAPCALPSTLCLRVDSLLARFCFARLSSAQHALETHSVWTIQSAFRVSDNIEVYKFKIVADLSSFRVSDHVRASSRNKISHEAIIVKWFSCRK